MRETNNGERDANEGAAATSPLQTNTPATSSLPPQNRRVVRLRCNYPVTCSMLGKRFTAQVVDMGLEGLRLEMPQKVDRGQLIAIRYEGPTTCYDYDTVQARIVWARSQPNGSTMLAGVAYINPSPYLERSFIRHLLRVFDLDKLSIADRRRDVRMPVSLQASLDATELHEDAWIRDIGLGGALVECKSDLPLGTDICICLTTADAEPVAFDANVVRKSRTNFNEAWLLGVRFTGPSEDNHSHVGRVLRTRAFES